MKFEYSKEPLMIILSGPSGVGKGTLKELYMNAHAENTYFSVSLTTRQPRIHEKDGVDYKFVSKEEFVKLIDEDNFYEWAQVHGNYYGTPKKRALEELANGNDVIFDIDVQGGINLKKICPHAIMIFIAPPDIATLEKRLRGRGTEDEETIQKRLKNALGELEQIDEYEYVVINNDLEEAFRKLETIINAEKTKKIIKI